MTSQHSLTTPTLSTHHALLTLNTPDSLLSQHTTNSQLSPHNKFPYHTLPILSPHTLHFLAAHSPLSYYSLIPLPSLSPYYTIPTLFYHTPQYLPRFLRSYQSPLASPHSLTTHPTLLPHFLLSYKSHSPLSNLSLLPNIPTFITLSTLSPHSPISHSPLFYLTPYTLSPPPLFPGRTLG